MEFQQAVRHLADTENVPLSTPRQNTGFTDSSFAVSLSSSRHFNEATTASVYFLSK